MDCLCAPSTNLALIVQAPAQFAVQRAAARAAGNRVRR